MCEWSKAGRLFSPEGNGREQHGPIKHNASRTWHLKLSTAEFKKAKTGEITSVMYCNLTKSIISTHDQDKNYLLVFVSTFILEIWCVFYTYRHTLFYWASFYCALQLLLFWLLVLFLFRVTACGNLLVSKFGDIFSNSSLISCVWVTFWYVSHCFFLLMIFIMVICDGWPGMLLLQVTEGSRWCLTFFKQ